MSCEIRNTSSLEPDDVARVEQALKAALKGQCVRIQANGSETANVLVTLSENLKGFLWVAELHQGPATVQMFKVVPHSAEFSGAARALPLSIHSERFWDGPDRILDAALVSSPAGDRLLVLLLPDAMLIRNLNKYSESKIAISLAISPSTFRDPSGTLSQEVGNSIEARHGRRNCSVSLDTYTLIKCEDYRGESMSVAGAPIRGGQIVPASTNCARGKGTSWFVTGTGDDTQPDFLEIVFSQNSESAVGSNRVNFSGPILSIHGGQGDASSTVIVKNLRTRNYEAYRLSISCTQ
jgi:hypothetical protein